MHDGDRRAFLKKLAMTTAYATPVVRTLAAPDPAAAQVLSKKGGGNAGGKGKGKGKGKGGGFMKGWDMDKGKGADFTFPTAPWSNDD